MESFSDIFEAFGGPAEVGRVIGVTTEHASLMKQRGSIPPTYWQALIDGAAERGIEGINWETLATLAAQKRKPRKNGSAPFTVARGTPSAEYVPGAAAESRPGKSSATAPEPEGAK